MDNVVAPVDPEDLTGQVELEGIVPLFNGNYSCVYKGKLRGREVSAVYFSFLGDTDTTTPWTGCGKDHSSRWL
jgi:hypothetical protein